MSSFSRPRIDQGVRGLRRRQRRDLRVRRGTIHALIGPNGAGKTTCFNLLTKFLSRRAGQILFKGRDITAHAAGRWWRASGWFARSRFRPCFPHLTVLRERAHRAAAAARRLVRLLALRSACSTRFNDRARELLDDVGLARFADTPAVELPYGRKRALEIATTLALEPEMMLLDEPTAGMAHEDIDRIAALIKRIAAEPHRADGRAQSQRRGRPVRHHHGADARPGPGRGRLRDCPDERVRKPTWGRACLKRIAGAAGMRLRRGAAAEVADLQGLVRRDRTSCTASTSTCARARSSRCSAATAPARPRR